jgi:hypothetical protein
MPRPGELLDAVIVGIGNKAKHFSNIQSFEQTLSKLGITERDWLS